MKDGELGLCPRRERGRRAGYVYVCVAKGADMGMVSVRKDIYMDRWPLFVSTRGGMYVLRR